MARSIFATRSNSQLWASDLMWPNRSRLDVLDGAVDQLLGEGVVVARVLEVLEEQVCRSVGSCWTAG